MLKRVENPPNPFLRHSYDWLDVSPEQPLEIYEEQARSIISENDRPDIGFRPESQLRLWGSMNSSP